MTDGSKKALFELQSSVLLPNSNIFQPTPNDVLQKINLELAVQVQSMLHGEYFLSSHVGSFSIVTSEDQPSLFSTSSP